MKKVLSFLMLLFLVLTLSACSEQSKIQKVANEYVADYIINGSFKDPASARITKIGYVTAGEGKDFDGMILFTVSANNSYGAKVSADYVMTVGGDYDKFCSSAEKNNYDICDVELDAGPVNKRLEKHWKDIGVS